MRHVFVSLAAAGCIWSTAQLGAAASEGGPGRARADFAPTRGAAVDASFDGTAPAAADAPAAPEDDLAFEKNLDLLHVQMKLRVLSVLSDNEFFVSRGILKRYLDEQSALCAELGEASRKDVNATSDWAKAVQQTRKDEAETLQKVAEDWGRKFLNSATAGAKDDSAKSKSILVLEREYQAKAAEWAKSMKNNVLEIAQYVESMAARLNQQTANSEGLKSWRTASRRVYRGAIFETDDLVKGIVALEKERLYYNGCLEAMKNVQDGLKIVDFVMDDKSFWESRAEQARDLAADYLKKEYGNDDPVTKESIGWAVDKVYNVLKKSKAAYDKCSDLDNDPVLAENPTALAGCKRMAAFGALYDSVLDVGKDCTFTAPLRPLFSVLEFYSKGMGTIEPFARAMQKFHNQVSQGYKGFQKLGVWSDLLDKDLGPFWESSLMKHYQMQIASGHDQWEGKDLKYYMPVGKDVVPLGYLTFSRAQYETLCDALAAERMIYARAEASRGVGSWIAENMFEWRNKNILSPTESPSYAKSLKAAARKSPLLAKGKEKDILALAQGLPVEVSGKQSTAQWLLDRLDTELDLMADELAARTGAPKFDAECMKRWAAFKEMVRNERVALTPEQIVRLFGYSESAGGRLDQVHKFLRGIANQRKWRKLGTARVGVPMVTSTDESRAVVPSSTVHLTAMVIVSDLAPGREIDVQAAWTLPEWAGGARTQQAKLSNGLSRLTIDLHVPPSVPRQPFDVKVVVRVPIGEGEEAAMEGTGSFTPPPAGSRGGMIERLARGRLGAEGLDLARLLAGVLEADGETAPKFRDFSGEGSFDVEVLPLSIASVRCAAFNATGIDITSDDLESLKDQRGTGGLKFTLYRALSADGPFDKAVAEQMALGGDALVKNDPETMGGRIAKNMFRILDLGQDAPDAPHKPHYYQVAQVAVDARLKPVGKEVRSKVLAPSTKAVLAARAPFAMSGELKMSGSQPPFWHSVSVSLSLPDQAFDATDVQFTVSCDGWSGQFFARGGPGGSGIARIMVPGRPGATPLTISAQGDGMSATASFTIAADPAVEKGVEEVAQRIIDEGARVAKEQATGPDRIKAKIKQIDDELASKGASMPQFLRIDNRWDRAKAEVELKEWTDVYMVHSAAGARADAARVRGDYRAWLLALGDLGKSVAAECDVAKARLKLMRDFEAQIAAAPDAREDLKKSYGPEEMARIDQVEKDQESRCGRDLAGHLSTVAQAAQMAGDAGTLLDARRRQFEFWTKQEMMNNPALISLAAQFADEIAMMTGAREQAAQVLDWANQLRIAASPADQREAVKQQIRPQDAPAWWPKGRAYGAPDEKQKADLRTITEKALNSPTTRPA